MKLLQRVNRATYRAAIADERNQGRLPLAWLTFGYVDGHGWGFLHPWAQLALFPAKGTPRGYRNQARLHERFWLLRVRPAWGTRRHRNHDYDIEGRYWHGLAWRVSWGYWWRWRGIRIPRPRWVILDPDIVTHDPGKADDWGQRPGEDWPK